MTAAGGTVVAVEEALPLVMGNLREAFMAGSRGESVVFSSDLSFLAEGGISNAVQAADADGAVAATVLVRMIVVGTTGAGEVVIAWAELLAVAVGLVLIGCVLMMNWRCGEICWESDDGTPS